MSMSQSYLDKTFVVVDPDARIRKPGELMTFQTYVAGDTLPSGEQVGNVKRIPKGAKVKVDDIEVQLTGSAASIIFAHAMSTDGATEYGWTSTRNFRDKFVNETLGEILPQPGANKYGPNAAWERGDYLGQRTLVQIVDIKLEIEHIALDTLEPYLALVEAAARDGVLVAINSGFRSYPQQKALYEGYQKHLPGYNLAAPPGRSNHQNGVAFDIRVAGGNGDPTYEWLKQHAPAFGFIRTVNKEPWHWEYNKARAATAVAAHTFKTSSVAV